MYMHCTDYVTRIKLVWITCPFHFSLKLLYTEFILVQIVKKALGIIETLSNQFLDQTSTEQSV